MSPPAEGTVRLRLLAASDEALYATLYGDPATMHHVGPALDPDACRGSFAAALRANAATPPRARTWVICLAGDEAGIGLAGLRWDGAGGAELGIVLPPDRQGQGFATAAIRALQGPAFGEFALARLHTRHDPAHALAGGLMAGLGFACTDAGGEGRARRWELAAPR